MSNKNRHIVNHPHKSSYDDGGRVRVAGMEKLIIPLVGGAVAGPLASELKRKITGSGFFTGPEKSSAPKEPPSSSYDEEGMSMANKQGKFKNGGPVKYHGG